MARTEVQTAFRNPLATDPDREQRVRERAYRLWEADGKPYGHDVEYWERARELIGMEDSANPVNPTHPPHEAEAEIQRNPGESPGADRGGVKTTPPAKSRVRAKSKKAT